MGSITKTKTIAQQPTVTAGAYSANDAVGGLLTFANACEKGRRSGIVQSVVIIDEAKQSVALELHLYNRTFTPTADNAAVDPTDADLANYVGSVKIATGDYTDFADNSAATVATSGLGFELVSGGTSLFGQLVTRGTPTYAATDDVTVKIVILQD